MFCYFLSNPGEFVPIQIQVIQVYSSLVLSAAVTNQNSALFLLALVYSAPTWHQAYRAAYQLLVMINFIGLLLIVSGCFNSSQIK